MDQDQNDTTGNIRFIVIIPPDNVLAECNNIAIIRCPNGCHLNFINKGQSSVYVRAGKEDAEEWQVATVIKPGDRYGNQLYGCQEFDPKGQWNLEVSPTETLEPTKATTQPFTVK